jgi:predicted Zn-dependent protease
VLSVSTERQLGTRMAAELEQQVALVADPAVQAYVQALGAELVARAPEVPAGTRFEFRVIDDPETVNAMALPGGYIYVYSGLLHGARNAAEVAGVLAHEIAHVAERHVAAQLVTALGAQALVALAQGGEAGELGRRALALLTDGALSAHSRTAEREADELAVQYLVRAGWNPRSYASFLRRLGTGGQEGLVTSFLRSHPHPEERAERAEALVSQLQRVPTRQDDQRFAAIVARLKPAGQRR